MSGLLVSHLDVFQRGVTLKWCERYSCGAVALPSGEVERLSVSDGEDLTHQSMLTDLLIDARPQYVAELIESDSSFLNRVASVSSLPVVFRSYGPTCDEVIEG